MLRSVNAVGQSTSAMNVDGCVIVRMLQGNTTEWWCLSADAARIAALNVVH